MHVKCQHEKLELVEFMPMKLLIENGEKKVEQWSHCVYQFLEHVQGTQYQQKNNHLTSAADAITKSQCSS